MKQGIQILLWLTCLLAVLAGIYVFRPHQLFFLADDFIHIPESAHNLLAQRNSLRPVGNLSIHLDYLWSKKSPFGYHFTNLILHLTNSFLVFIFCKILMKKYASLVGSTIFSVTVAIVFFTYPFHSESIFWIIGRSGMLGALFTLSALLFFLKRNRSWYFFIASLICFELALLSYESSWIFPIIAIAFAYADTRLKQSSKKVELIKIALIWFLFLLNLIIRLQVTGELFNAYDSGSILNFDIKELSLNFFRLFFRTLLPPFVHTKYFVAASIVSLLIIALLIYILRRQKKIHLLFVLLSFSWLISYLPYLSLGIDTHGVEGGRYLYLPAVFFCTWLLYLLFLLLKKQWFVIVFFAITMGNFYWLFQARSYFIKAGAITKTAYSEINNWQQKHVLFLENLPQYNRGAVIFRLGFEEGLNWLYPNIKTKIFIVSTDDSDVRIRAHYKPDFKIVYQEAQQLLQVPFYLERDTTFAKTYRQVPAKHLLFVPGEDVWFSFSDSTLLISK